MRQNKQATELIAAYTAAYKAGWVKSTKWRMRDYFVFFQEWMNLTGYTLDQIEVEQVSEMQAWLRKKGFSPNYIFVIMRKMRGLLEWAIFTRRKRTSIVWRFVPRIQQQKVNRVPFTYEEYQRVLAESRSFMPGRTRKPDLRYKPFWPYAIIIGWHTGLRISDVIYLKWSSIDLDKGIITVQPKKKASRREVLRIPIEPELHENLQWLYANRIERCDWVLPEMAGWAINECATISYGFRHICDRCGLTKHSFHSFRHGFVTRLLNAGVDPLTIASMTGHSLTQLQEYAHISIEAKANALAKARQALHTSKLHDLGFTRTVGIQTDVHT